MPNGNDPDLERALQQYIEAKMREDKEKEEEARRQIQSQLNSAFPDPQNPQQPHH